MVLRIINGDNEEVRTTMLHKTQILSRALGISAEVDAETSAFATADISDKSVVGKQSPVGGVVAAAEKLNASADEIDAQRAGAVDQNISKATRTSAGGVDKAVEVWW
ncbi:hypothetical protein Aduo_005290 [Ancylostoma duodenale]